MKKLALSKETIRNLNDKEMDQAIGGKPICNPHIGTICQVTVTYVPGFTHKTC